MISSQGIVKFLRKTCFSKVTSFKFPENQGNLEDKFKTLQPPINSKELNFLQCCLTMDPPERLSADSLIKHPFMEWQGKQTHYYHAELKQVPSAGGDGHWASTTRKKPDRGHVFSMAKPVANTQPGTTTNVTNVPKRRTQPATQNQQPVPALPSSQLPDPSGRAQGTTTPQNMDPVGSNAQGPFATNRTNWFNSCIVGQGYHNASQAGLPSLLNLQLAQGNTFNYQSTPTAQSPIPNSKVAGGSWKHHAKPLPTTSMNAAAASTISGTTDGGNAAIASLNPSCVATSIHFPNI